MTLIHDPVLAIDRERTGLDWEAQGTRKIPAMNLQVLVELPRARSGERPPALLQEQWTTFFD